MKPLIVRTSAGTAALIVAPALFTACIAPAQAADGDGTGLKIPASYVEMGALHVPRDSAKFGEYTGLHESGGYLIGNFGIFGGDGYGNGTKRWEIIGTDLGLTSRSVSASISDQGKWNIGITYDALTHYTSDSYQTPYSGAMGGNVFTLPGFGVITGTNTRTGISAAQSSFFHNLDINNSRDNTSVTGTRILNQEWNIKVDFNHLEQSGAKLQGFGSAGIGGVTGERISILPMPTNFKTDTINAGLNWVGDKGNMTASYFGSFFRDGYNGVQFANWTTAGNTLQTMSTPPSNDFHQLNLNGGYVISPTTRLVGGLSYGRNTQNDFFAGNFDPGMMTTPSPALSLNGSIITTHADLKLTNQTTKNLALSASAKYDNRDNRTASNAYNFHAIDGLAHDANYPNAPYSIKKTQLELAGDYRFNARQKVRVAYNHDETDRNCNQYAVIAPTIINGNLNTYPAGTSCLTATETKEDKISGTYRQKVNETVNANATYAYSDRRTDFNQNAIAPFIGTDGNPNLSAPATTLIRGLNAAEYRGFHPFFDASRKQQMLKAGANWQATERVSFGLNGRYTGDDYDSTYGMQKGHSWSLNLDSTFNYRENGVLAAYVTQQERTRDLTNVQRSPTLAAVAPTATAVGIPSGATWSNSLSDTDTTIGLNLKQGGLMGGKLEVSGDAAYSYGKTGYSTVLNYSTTTLGGLTCGSPSIFTCVPLPDIRSELMQFKLSGIYSVDKNAKLSFGYLFQRLKSDDFYYNGLQAGFTPTSVLPTNQTAPSYTENVVWLSYIYNFR